MASAQHQANIEFQNAINLENSGWNRAQHFSEQKCGKYDDNNPRPKEKSVEVENCYARVVEEYVYPYALNKSSVANYLLERKEVAIKYKKGSIDRDEALLAMQKSWLNYQNSLNQMYNQGMKNAYQQDLIASQQRQQAIQNLNQMEVERQKAQQVNAPTTTNCQKFGNTMNCTTW